MGWLPDPPYTCEVLVRIPLDRGTSAFRCPSCNAIHVVDPLHAGALDFEMDGSMLANVEYGGHQVETFSGPIAQRVRASTGQRGGEARRFYKAKVGTPREAPVAEAYLSPPPPRPSQASVVEKLDAAIRAGTVRQAGLPLEMNRLYNAYEAATEQLARDPAQAAAVLRQMVARYPSFAAGRAKLAAALVSTGKPREALQHISHAHSLAPHDPELHFTAGRAQEALGDAKSAFEQYQQALRDDPHHVGAMARLGAAHRERGEAQLAERWLLTALTKTQAQQQDQIPGGETQPNDLPLIFCNLAMAYEQVGIWDGAVDCWQQCLSLKPRDATYGQRLQQAEHYLDLGRRNADVTVSTYTLQELDPTGVAQISFRMATGADTRARNRQVFGSSVRAYASGTAQLTSMVPTAQRQEIECQLTICGIAGVYRGSKPLFRFNDEGTLAMTGAEFHEAWGMLPSKVAGLFHAYCLETNPQWGSP